MFASDINCDDVQTDGDRVTMNGNIKFRKYVIDHSYIGNHELITFEGAAKILGCSVRTLRYRQASGEMPNRLRRGRRLYYKLADIFTLANEEF